MSSGVHLSIFVFILYYYHDCVSYLVKTMFLTQVGKMSYHVIVPARRTDQQLKNTFLKRFIYIYHVYRILNNHDNILVTTNF